MWRPTSSDCWSRNESDTYAKLSNPKTGLYFQSPNYVYAYLEHELATGVMG